MQAPIANAHSLNLMVRTPMISAASSSSRIASHDRPTRLRSRFRTPRTTRMMTVRPSQKYGVASATPKIGLPSGELARRVRDVRRNPVAAGEVRVLVATIRMISAKPSVTMAR